MGKSMKKNVFILVLVILLSIPLSAYAKTYVDEAGGFSIEIPEDANTYYYTPTDTNMTGTLLQSAQSGSQMTKLLIGSYNEENVLGYSLKIEVTPLPAETDAPATAELTAIRETQAEEYTFSDIADMEIGGKAAKLLEGSSTRDSSYSTRIIALENGGNVIVETVIYKNDDTAYLQQAEAVLATTVFGTLPAVTPEMAQAAAPPPDTEPTPSAETPMVSQPVSQAVDPDTLQPAPEAANTVAGDIWAANTAAGVPLVVLLLILACIVILIIVVVVIIFRKKKAGHKKAGAETRVERHKGTNNKEQEKRKKGTRFK